MDLLLEECTARFEAGRPQGVSGPMALDIGKDDVIGIEQRTMME